MSTNRPPAGRQPQSVYIRRRLTVLGVLVVIIVVIILIVARPGSGKPSAANTHTPTAGHTTSAKVPTCKDANIQVIGVTDATSYAAGVDPMISLSITNTGPSDCSFNVGTNAQKYVITSGTDLIWQSTDCQTDAKSLVVTLKPGVTQKTTPFAWKRVRSNPSACSATNPPQVTAKGASYHLTVTVNGVTSTTANSPQFILR